jgi:hypothetical protein
MLWKTAALLAAAFVMMCAAPVPSKSAPAKAPPAKAAAAKPAAKPAPEPFFDARDPAMMVPLLASAGAKAEIAHKEADSVFLSVTSKTVAFTTQFAGCDAQGRKCAVALFDSAAMAGSPTLAQINSYNQTSAMCRGYQDKSGKAHILYSSLLFADDSRSRILQQLAAWRGCLAEFHDFTADPVAYLAAAP